MTGLFMIFIHNC